MAETASQSTTETTPRATVAGSGSVAGDLCAFLEEEAPRLEVVGSSVGALSGFAIDFATWIEDDPNRKLKDAAELDSITMSSCPKSRTRVLKSLGVTSFRAALEG